MFLLSLIMPYRYHLPRPIFGHIAKIAPIRIMRKYIYICIRDISQPIR